MVTITAKTPLATIKKLAPACRCEKCSHGCTMGSGMLAEGDVTKLAAFLGVSEKELKEKHLEEVELFNKTMLRPKLERKERIGQKEEEGNGQNVNLPYGKCTFYDAKKGCTVHSAKPLQCVVSMGCGEHGEALNTWFVVNHVLNKHDPEAVRQYAAYVDVGGKVIPGASVEEVVPDKKVRDNIMNFEILR